MWLKGLNTDTQILTSLASLFFSKHCLVDLPSGHLTSSIRVRCGCKLILLTAVNHRSTQRLLPHLVLSLSPPPTVWIPSPPLWVSHMHLLYQATFCIRSFLEPSHPATALLLTSHPALGLLGLLPHYNGGNHGGCGLYQQAISGGVYALEFLFIPMPPPSPPFLF